MQKEKTKRLLDFAPLVILYTYLCFAVYTVCTSGIIFHWKVYVAIVFLLLSTALFLYKHQLGVLVLGATLIFGLVGLLSVDVAISTTTLTIGKTAESQIPIFFGQPKFLLWLAIHFILSGRYYVGILTEKYWLQLKSQIIHPKS
jgi:hypothetical protein